MTPLPAMLALDGPMYLYLAWLAFTLALVAVGGTYLFRPAIASAALKRIAVSWLALSIGVGVVSVQVFHRRFLPGGPMAPDFSMESVDGQSFSRDSLHGKVVLIEFWASWCGPCREALPEMLLLHGEFKSSRFVMIGVSEDKDQSQFEAFVAQHDMRWPQDWDPDGSLLSRFSSDAIPSYAVIGADGRLRFLQKGYTTETYAELRHVIRDALSPQVATISP